VIKITKLKKTMAYGPFEYLSLFVGLFALYVVQVGLYTVYVGYATTWNVVLGYLNGVLITAVINILAGAFFLMYHKKSRTMLEDRVLSDAEKKSLRSSKVGYFVLLASVGAGAIVGSYYLEYFLILPDHGYKYIWGLIPVWLISLIFDALYIALSIILQLRVTSRFDKMLASTPGVTYKRQTTQQQLVRNRGSRRSSIMRGKRPMYIGR
jgi:hypothetical protein